METTSDPPHQPFLSLNNSGERTGGNDFLYNDLEDSSDQSCWFCMKGKSTRHSRPLRLKKFAFSVFNVSNAALGSGVLAFPYAYRRAGWGLGLIFTAFCAVVLCWSLTVILRTSRRVGVRSYQELINTLFGAAWGNFFLFAVLCYCFFTCVSYLLVISSQVKEFVIAANPDSALANDNVLIIIAAAVVWPLVNLRTMEMLGPFSFIGVLAVLYTVCLVTVYGVTHWHEEPAFTTSPAMVSAVPVVGFALMCHMTVIPATGGLQEFWPSINNPGYTRFRTLVSISVLVISLCFTLYFPMGFFGYHIFGDATSEDILDNFGTNVAANQHVILPNTADVKVARLCMGITTLLGFPVISFVARLGIYDAFNMPHEKVSWRTRTFITVAWVVLVAGTAILLRVIHLGIGWIMGLIGSTSAVLVQYLFPAAMLWKEKKKGRAIFLLVCGILILVAGLGVTVFSVLCSTKSVSEGLCTNLGIKFGAD